MQTEVGLASRPGHVASLTWVEIDGEIVALDVDTGVVHLLSDSAAVLFPMFDGEMSVAELLSDVCAVYSVPREQVREDLVNFVQDAVSLGILSVD